MLTRGLSVISVVVSLMHVHRLYFCYCIFCFLQNRFRTFCIICAYKGVIVISVAIFVFVLYVHGLYLFCCIFCFPRNKSLFPCIYAYKVVMCLYMYFLLSCIYFKAYVSNYKMIWVFFVPWFWAPLGFYFILFLWVPLLACMTVGKDFVMTLLSFVL